MFPRYLQDIVSGNGFFLALSDIFCEVNFFLLKCSPLRILSEVLIRLSRIISKLVFIHLAIGLIDSSAKATL